MNEILGGKGERELGDIYKVKKGCEGLWSEVHLRHVVDDHVSYKKAALNFRIANKWSKLGGGGPKRGDCLLIPCHDTPSLLFPNLFILFLLAFYYIKMFY